MTENLLQAFWRQTGESSNRVALSWNEAGERRTLSWGEYGRQVARLASAIQCAGLQPGDRVALYSDNCPEWVLADLAIQSAGGVTVPLYPNLTADQARYMIEHSEARFAFVRGSARRANVEDRVKTTVSLEGLRDFMGGGSDDRAPHEARANGLESFALSTLVYTSGTTANPRGGVMLTHENLRAQVKNLLERHPRTSDDEVLSFLPLAHVAERVNALRQLVVGYHVHFTGGIESILPSLREIRPTRFLGVPRIWEKLEDEVRKAGVSRGPEAKRLLGLERCRSFYSAAAPLGAETLSFFAGLGIPILQGYGMTECAGACHYASEDDPAPGSVGTPLPGVECKLGPEGEILLRGPSVFQGYYKDVEATREALRDGWLHTGDLASRDERGNYRITGRIKDIIVTSAGKNIAPAPLEEALKSHPMVSQAVVIGDGRKYLVALLTLAPGANRKDAEWPVMQHLARLNASWPSYQTIKAWAILEKDFSLEDGELTPSMKIRRPVVQAKYASLISSLYERSARYPS